MKKDKFYQLVSKKLCNTSNEEDEKALSEYLEKEDFKELFKKVEEEWNKEKPEVNTSKFIFPLAHQKMIEGIRKYEPTFGKKDSEKPNLRKRFLPYMRMAATLTAVFGLGIIIFFMAQRYEEPEGELALVNYKTLPGQHLEVTLPDSSKVILNGNSEIQFPEPFPIDKREVYIKGEAFFEIKKDPEKVFEVHFEQYQVQVLGTTFNINAYENNKNIKVSLLEGSIKVGHKDSLARQVLTPQYQLSFNRISHQSELSIFDVNKITGWRNRYFIFDNESLMNVLNILENNYSVSFNYDKKIVERCRINAEFNNESIWTILSAIEYATGISHQIESQNNIKLTGKGCN